MRIPNLYDEEALKHQFQLQTKFHWDLEKDIPWKMGIDLNKPLVPLDEDAILFPGASTEQRHVISQFMGLIIAASIYEMEECLIRLRKECWTSIHKKNPVSPEFIELGDLFFDEEHKHSQIFKRYVQLFAESINVDAKDLTNLLPKVEGTKTEFLLKKEMLLEGQSFWWIVAIVEQEFLLIYHSFKPFKNQMDPLFYTLHEKHFEEEARHASFPYLILQLLHSRSPNFISKFSLASGQILQTTWALHSLQRMKGVKYLENHNPFFKTLSSAQPLLEKVPSTRSVWKLLSSAPYVSALLNPGAHRKFLQFAKDSKVLRIPFPQYEQRKLVRY